MEAFYYMWGSNRRFAKEVRRRGLKVAVAGIPKTIDNDIPVIDKSFGFDTAVEEAQRAINAAHVEAESAENGVGVVKLIGRYSGGLFEYVEKRLKEDGHMVIVIAEGAGQDILDKDLSLGNEKDASGNKLLADNGLWISQKIKAPNATNSICYYKIVTGQPSDKLGEDFTELFKDF